MSDQPTPSAGAKPWLRISELLHAFDPNEDHRVALAHALKFAVFARARLSLMSLCPPRSPADREQEDEPWATLARWSQGRPSTGQAEPELTVRHLRVAGQDPVKACVGHLRSNPTDLVVLATHLLRGKVSWLGKSTAEALATRIGEMTLFVPQGVQGFVSTDDGSVTLQRILVAVAGEPRPEPAIEAARRIMVSIPVEAGTVSLIHVGDSEMPRVRLPDVPGWTWNTLCPPGEVVQTILTTAADMHAQLIVMTTAGHHGFLDAIRGTVTEHVLREAGCPLLAMPAGSFLG